MPKILVLCHAALLLCLSLLVFPGVVGVVWLSPGFAVAAVVLSVLFCATEVFSGLRWPAVVAMVASIVGLATGSAWAWGVAWCAVVAWFALLALEARANR
jgi:hypothetical protein